MRVYRIFLVTLLFAIFLAGIHCEDCFYTSCADSFSPLASACDASQGFYMQNYIPGGPRQECSNGGGKYYCCKADIRPDTRSGANDVIDDLKGIKHKGWATFYNVIPTSPLACGTLHNDDQIFTAIGLPYWNSKIGNPNKDPICGQKVKVTNLGNGKEVIVEVRDKCGSCGNDKLDLSVAAFRALGDDEEPVASRLGHDDTQWELI